MCLHVQSVSYKLTMCPLVTKSFTNQRPLECFSLTVPLFVTKHPMHVNKVAPKSKVHSYNIIILDMLSNCWGNQAQLKQPCYFYSEGRQKLRLLHYTTVFTICQQYNHCINGHNIWSNAPTVKSGIMAITTKLMPGNRFPGTKWICSSKCSHMPPLNKVLNISIPDSKLDSQI